jgi:hypothetical protein
MTEPSPDHPDDDDRPAEAADEHPNRFPEGGEQTEVAALDEAPDGQTPADTTRSSSDSLPPG